VSEFFVRSLVRNVLWGFLVVVGSLQAIERPNILLLMAEDMSPRVGAFGDEIAVTPNLDALAAKGVRYTHTFTTAGVCAPSRSAHIMGVNQISLGAQHMRTSERKEGGYKTVPPAPLKAYPELLRAAGYYTFTDSKLDYQFSGTLAGSGPMSIWSDEGFRTSWRKRASGQPFFGFINFNVTHESGTFAPLGAWPESFLHFKMQVIRAVFEGFQKDSEPVAPEGVVLPPYYPDIPSVRTEIARHYNNIHAMDKQVGALLMQLTRDGLADDTIVIWTTDHGDGLPRAKRELFDSGLRVPMIIYWPEKWRPVSVKAGAPDERMISFVDLAPTVLSLAGVEQPEYFQGRDFLSVETPPRRYIYATRDRIDEVMDRQRAVRDRRFKYIRSWHPEVSGGHPLAFRDIQVMTRDMRALWKAGKLSPVQARWFESVGREQLYDLHNDPHELTNLAKNPAWRHELERLRAALDEWLERVGDRSAQPEAEMVEALLCEGEPCVTPAPQIQRDKNHVVLKSTVVGASIVYRLDDGPWQVYTDPFPADEGTEISAHAQRYGWRLSEAVNLEL
jgi:arylsulfatase A-like enzyme